MTQEQEIDAAIAYARTLNSKSLGVAVGELMVAFGMDQEQAKTVLLISRLKTEE